jgi:HAD superfamily hydrolase (TIGR01490 family)
MAKPLKLALFDIDGTIFRSSLLIELINGLVEDGVMPLTAKKEADGEFKAWLDRKGDYEDYLKKVITIHLKYIAGKSFVEVSASAEQTIKKLRHRVYRYTRDLIASLKKQGYHLVTISGSPTYIVSKYAKIMGFAAYFGSEYQVKDGYFTGQVLNLETFYKKAVVLAGYLKAKKLKVDFKNSIAVGDTESDIPMLSAVGRPIAFNPNLELARYARRKKWEVVVERKDVIYGLREFKILNNG